MQRTSPRCDVLHKGGCDRLFAVARSVSVAVIARMLHRWEVPTPLEAHELILLVHESEKSSRRVAPVSG